MRRKGDGKHRHVTTVYFDTPRHVLRKSGIVLSVRDDGERRVQTVRASSRAGDVSAGAQEVTTVVAGDGPVPAHLPDADALHALTRRRRSGRLESVFTTEVDRTTLRFKSSAAEIRLAVDEGTIRVDRNGRSRQEPICEAELELLSGSSADMMDLALEVCESFDATLTHVTRSERGYALARPALRPRSRKAKPVILTPDLNVGTAFRSIVASALDHLFGNEIPVLLGRPGGVHQSRVAMRRLRAALRAFKTVLPYDKRKAFNSEFRWFQQRLAPARDWHVFLDETLPLIAQGAPRAGDRIERLRRLALEERRRATQDAVEVLHGRRYARLILKFQKWISNLESEIPTRAFDDRVGPFAKSVLRKTRRDLLDETRPLGRLPGEELHTLRKSGKKARYGTEFFSALWTSDDVKPYLKLMARLQDQLGASNDAVVARQILWNVRPGRLDSQTVRLVQDWSETRIQECIRTAQPHWRRLRKAKPFWE